MIFVVGQFCYINVSHTAYDITSPLVTILPAIGNHVTKLW